MNLRFDNEVENDTEFAQFPEIVYNGVYSLFRGNYSNENHDSFSSEQRVWPLH